MKKQPFLYWCKSYHDLGYNLYLTDLYGKDGIRMEKRYSYKAEKMLFCEQIIHHDRIIDTEYLETILDFLYKEIELQEKEYESK